MERITDLYAMDHWTRERYLAERERLERLLGKLSAESGGDQVAFAPLGSLMEGWRTGDPRTRHDPVATFFDELDVLDGKITTVVPRKDRATEVMSLLESAYARYRPGSPGGIRGDTYETDFEFERIRYAQRRCCFAAAHRPPCPPLPTWRLRVRRYAERPARGASHWHS